MKKLALVPLLAVAVMAGCQNKTKEPPIQPPTPTAAATPAPKTATYDVPAMMDPVQPSTPAIPMDDPSLLPPPVTSTPTATKVSSTPAKAAPAKVTPKATASRKYTVKKGDTLTGIAKRYYGNANAYKKIVSANPGINPNMIKVGQVINLP